MRILCISATKLEIDPLLRKLSVSPDQSVDQLDISYKKHRIKFRITGIGGVHTVYHLTKELSDEKYDLVLNLGICGSFIDDIKLGEVVYIEQDMFADLGVVGKEGFTTIFDAGLADKDYLPYKDGKLVNLKAENKFSIQSLRNVTGITVNRTTGSIEDAENLRLKFEADIESMEGAAFFYTCLLESVPFAVIRSVSNRVGVNDKGNWDISLATNNLSDVLMNYFNEI